MGRAVCRAKQSLLLNGREGSIFNPNSNGLQPTSDGLQPNSDALGELVWFWGVFK